MSNSSDLTSCPICLEDYDQEKHVPRVLPCIHSVCQPCLQKLIRPTPNNVICPQCRQRHPVDPISGIRSFKQNQYILEFIQKKAEFKSQALNNPSSPGFQRCPKHNRERTKFCQTDGCNMAICPKCQDDHMFHNVIEIEELHEAFKKAVVDMKEWTENAKTKLGQCERQIINERNCRMREIRTSRQTIIDMVNQKLDERIAYAEKKKEKTLQQILRGFWSLDAKLTTLREMDKKFDNTRGSPFDFKLMKGMKQDTLSKLSEISKCTGVGCMKKALWENEISHMCNNLLSVDQPLAPMKQLEDMNEGPDLNVGTPPPGPGGLSLPFVQTRKCSTTVSLPDGTDVTNNLKALPAGTCVIVSRADGAQLAAYWNGIAISLTAPQPPRGFTKAKKKK